MNLRQWKRNLRHDLEESWIEDGIETDCRECPKCSGTMNFYGHDINGDFPIGEGYWKCKKCGFTVYEKDL